MSLPGLAVRRPVAVATFFVGVAVIGVVSLLRMPVSLLPDIAYPRLVVWTVLPEASPVEVEGHVTEPIEAALSAVPGVLAIESLSAEGRSRVVVRFPWGTDMEFAQLHVRERLDNLAGTLPQGAERPTILRVDPGAEPILVASATATGPASLREIERLAETVFRRRLEQLEGVGRVAVVGGAEREIRVEVDPARLEAHGLSIGDVAEALEQANASAPGGTIRRGRHRYALRALGELTTLEQVAEVVVARGAGGGTVSVADMAAVTDGTAARESAAYLGGRPTIALLVYRERGANTVRAARRVEATFAELERQFPGVELATVTGQAGFITAAIGNVVWALLLGGLLAYLVLFPFLKDPRWPGVLALSIPISIVAAFVLLHVSGVSLDIMSLGGLALGVGMLVDASIVVLENVFRHRERGLAPAAAAIRGAEEVQGAITASTLTTIAVFGPIIYVEGLAGALFGELALAVAFSLLASLLVALTLLPVVAARLGPREGLSGPADRSVTSVIDRGLDRFEVGFARVAAAYERALARALDRPRRILAWTGGALAVALVVAFFLPRDVLPGVDQRAFTARLNLAPGTPIERSEALALRVDAWLREQPEVEAVLTRVGQASPAEAVRAEGRGSHTAILDVRLGSAGAPTREVMERLRDAFDNLPPGVLALGTGAATELGAVLGTAESDLAVEVRGEDRETLRLVAGEISRRFAALPMLADVSSGLEEAHPEIRISLDRDAIAGHGLAIEEVVRALTDRTRGRIATQLVEFDRRVPVLVRAGERERGDLNRILAGLVGGVPLRLLVEVEKTAGPTAIRRTDQERVVPVTADVAVGGLSGAIEAVEDVLRGLDLPGGVKVEVGGGGEELGRSFRGLGFAFLLALLLVFMILAAQFESLRLPFIVLLAVPLSLIGAILLLALAGSGLNTMSLIGIVVLIGIAVNDAIVKVEFIRRAQAWGLPARAAIEEAGRARFRPIVMTSVTTILGLLPMATGLGSGAELRSPLAIAMIGGMATSTALTLFVVPIFYQWLARS